MKTEKRKTKSFISKYLLLVALAFVTPAFADDELPEFDDDVTDNDVPINDYIPLALIAGAVYGYKALLKKKQLS